MRSTRKMKSLRHSLFAGMMAVVFAIGMTVPAFAAVTEVDYCTEEGGTWIEKTEAFTDEAAGISWDGDETITLSNASLYGLEIAGSAIIQLEGESDVAYIDSDDNLTIQGNKDVPADEKPILNLVDDGELYAEKLTIEGATVNVDAPDAYMYVSGDITIDNSKFAVTDPEYSITLGNDGADDEADITITDSEVDLGYGGSLCAGGSITIDNSNVDVAYAPLFDEPWVMNIHSHSNNIVLKNMDNGATLVDEEGDYGDYITTDDEDGVHLKAAGTPGYNKEAEEEEPAEEPETPAAEPAAPAAGGIPATGDATGTAAGICAALAVCALATMVIARRRTQQ